MILLHVSSILILIVVTRNCVKCLCYNCQCQVR